MSARHVRFDVGAVGQPIKDLEERVKALEMDRRRREVRDFFLEYVFGFIFRDVGREIALARSGRDAGNFLAALGLLCYTEVMGGVRRRTLAPREGRTNFDSFFKELGPGYQALLTDGLDAYNLLRCGMAHEYLIKGDAPTIFMLKGDESRGVGQRSDGSLYLVVEKYFEDFAAACRKLYADRLAAPELPPEISGR